MRQISLSVLEYSTETKARLRLQEEVLRINGVDKYRAQNRVTMGVLIERFIKEERIEEIATQPPGEVKNPDGLAYSTVMSYRSNLNKHIKPAWQHVLPVRLQTASSERMAQEAAACTQVKGSHSWASTSLA